MPDRQLAADPSLTCISGWHIVPVRRVVYRSNAMLTSAEHLMRVFGLSPNAWYNSYLTCSLEQPRIDFYVDPLWLACNFTSQIYRAALKLIWAVSLKLQINSYLTWQQFFGRCRTVSYFKLTSSLCRVYGSMLSSDPFLTWQQFFGLRSYYVMLQAYAGKTACDWPVFDIFLFLRMQ